VEHRLIYLAQFRLNRTQIDTCNEQLAAKLHQHLEHRQTIPLIQFRWEIVCQINALTTGGFSKESGLGYL
jgi:uncharacterized tellurite resistance protein B-like protein